MPQGPPPPGNYQNHGPADLSKQISNMHQPAHHPLPPGALPANTQMTMANAGHGSPLQQGRSAQGNAQFFHSRNQQIRQPNHMPRPPIAGASMAPNHTPNTPNMTYTGAVSTYFYTSMGENYYRLELSLLSV